MVTAASHESPRVDLGGLLEELALPAHRQGRLVHLERMAPRAGRTAPWPDWVAPEVVAAYTARGIHTLWRHQADALAILRAGGHAALATGTASGKSLAYQAPALHAVRAARVPRQQRGASVLYLAPTKALAHDQYASLVGLGLDVRISTHDGDSSREERDWTRQHGEYVLTNPDMLHHSLLPTHDRWAGFLGSLAYVVVDEAHHYRGVFGAHVSAVLRRLRRVAALYGAAPQFVFTSATMAQPAATAERLCGLQVSAITDDASPRGELSIGLWEPPLTDHTGENGAPVRRSASTETADLLADLVAARVRTLAFVRSRSGVEHVAARAADLLAEIDASLPATVASYRGGYLPEERRAIETDLRSGRLLGLAATNALELGIDISGLDAVLLAGFPGTRAALWQQIGRAGRDGGAGAAMLVARDDPLDTYLVHHPEALLAQPVEACVFDPANPHVLGPHLCAAAQEAPLTRADLPLFGETAGEVVEQLVALGLLRKRPRGWFWTDRGRAADLADLRSAGGAVQLIEVGTGRVIGTANGGSADASAHPGAVYVHRGETWLVHELDLDERVAQLERVEVDYSTTSRATTEIAIVADLEHRDWGEVRLSRGEVEVTSQVVSFLTRRQPSGEVIAEEALDLPPRTLRTAAVWWTVPDETLARAGLSGEVDLAGAAHAAEHCSIGLLPLIATCDRWDIGGVSTVRHPDTGMLTVFVHDGHPGGAGFAERGYRTAKTWLSATRATIAECTCAEGCPSCVQSPKCGNQNNPLDKAGALRLLNVVLACADDLA